MAFVLNKTENNRKPRQVGPQKRQKFCVRIFHVSCFLHRLLCSHNNYALQCKGQKISQWYLSFISWYSGNSWLFRFHLSVQKREEAVGGRSCWWWSGCRRCFGIQDNSLPHCVDTEFTWRKRSNNNKRCAVCYELSSVSDVRLQKKKNARLLRWTWELADVHFWQCIRDILGIKSRHG